MEEDRLDSGEVWRKPPKAFVIIFDVFVWGGDVECMRMTMYHAFLGKNYAQLMISRCNSHLPAINWLFPLRRRVLSIKTSGHHRFMDGGYVSSAAGTSPGPKGKDKDMVALRLRLFRAAHQEEEGKQIIRSSDIIGDLWVDDCVDNSPSIIWHEDLRRVQQRAA